MNDPQLRLADLLCKAFNPKAAADFDAVLGIHCPEGYVVLQIEQCRIREDAAAPVDVNLYFKDFPALQVLLLDVIISPSFLYDAFLAEQIRMDGYLLWLPRLLMIFR